MGSQSLPNLLQAFLQWMPQVKSGTYKARPLSIPLQAQPGGLAQCGSHTKLEKWLLKGTRAMPQVWTGNTHFPYSLLHAHGSCKNNGVRNIKKKIIILPSVCRLHFLCQGGLQV